jgi:hypothetical protein
MAYETGGLLQFFSPDLSTRPGAQSAMDSAKFCFLLVAGFRIVLYAIAALGTGVAFGPTLPAAVTASLLASLALDIGLPLAAAWRLHLYKGAFVVPVATGFYVVGILLAPAVGSIVIGTLFTAVFVGGIRAAWALRRGTGFEDDYYATFS